ncbi:MAG: glycine zipper domain-containing protein [Ginsengibacter sp.]
MKNIILSLSVIFTIAACGDKADIGSAGQSQMPVVPIYNNSALSDTAKPEDAFYQPAKSASRPRPARVKTVYITVPAKPNRETIAIPPAQTSPVPVITPPVPASAGTVPVPSSTGTDNTGNAETASTIPQPANKKGWSKAAKGAVIGAGAGVIGGAILSKKKGVGAIIGGVIGAAGGYVIGKGMDKKDNRFITN